MKPMYVYILASRSGVLHVGVTNDLERRMYEHRHKLVPGFTAKYNVDLLMWYEEFPDPSQAIEAEKRIKGWRREKKVALIEERNPTWRDLYEPGDVDSTGARPEASARDRHSEGSGSDPRNLQTGATFDVEIPRSPRLPRNDACVG
jgi:putative endonuclease